MTHQEILEAIKGMTLLEIKELVDAMKEEFGVTGAVAVAGGAAPAAALAGLKDDRFSIAPECGSKLYVAYAPYTGE